MEPTSRGRFAAYLAATIPPPPARPGPVAVVVPEWLRELREDLAAAHRERVRGSFR